MSLDPGTLDPRSVGGDLAWTEINYMIEPLFDYDEASNFYPRLATSWETLDDLTWQFKLREGVTFHNGEPFNAESVKYSIESTLDPEKGYRNASWIREIDRVEILDDYTVNIITKNPFRSLLYNLGWIYMLEPKAAEELGDDISANPIGTGPYKFVSYAPNEELVMEANEDYWGEKPTTKTLVFRTLSEEATRLAALETGEVAIITNVSPDAIERLEANEELEVITGEPMRIIHLAFVVDRPPFDDHTLREAFQYAVDRQALVDTILGGLGFVADRHIYHPSIFGFNEDLQPYSYDPEKAKELLAEAGYPDGITVSFGCPDGRYLRDRVVCEAVVGQFAEAGITAELETSEWGSFFQSAVTGKQYDIYLLGWQAVDPYNQIAWWFTTEGSPNGYSNERVDELVVEAQATLDDQEVEAMTKEIQQLIWDDLPWVSMYFQPKIYGKNVALKDLVLSETIPQMDFMRAYMGE
jgi:peptide/nickel transport system substrate-binding protein